MKDTTQKYELYNENGSFECFIREMKSRIERGTEKHGDFTQYSRTELFDSLVNEWHELLEAISNQEEMISKMPKIAGECVDVANLAYMLYWAYIGGLLKVSAEIGGKGR